MGYVGGVRPCPRLAPRALLLRAADVVLEHPSPPVVRLQATVALCLIDIAFTGIRWGRRLWPR